MFFVRPLFGLCRLYEEFIGPFYQLLTYSQFILGLKRIYEKRSKGNIKRVAYSYLQTWKPCQTETTAL